MKAGDLVRLKLKAHDLDGKTGIITELSDPSPMFPYQVASIAFDHVVCDGFSIRVLEVISESR